MAGGTPYFIPLETPGTSVIDGRRLIADRVHSYLGLTTDPRCARRHGQRNTGPRAGSRFLNGTLSIHVDLERRLAEVRGQGSGMVFSTGYQSTSVPSRLSLAVAMW